MVEDVLTLQVSSQHDEMGEFEAKVIIHNEEEPCDDTPMQRDVTDLATAAVGGNKVLCDDCTWPEGAHDAFEAEKEEYT